MKLTAPLYYKDFQCIADRCRHSCCVGWEIDVDEETEKKYTTLSGEYADTVRASIDREGTPHFRLLAGERCPHLDRCGLCKIITAYGDDALCDICREHPRFYNETARGKEVGLGMSCEEACRIILSSDDYDKWVTLGDVEEGDVSEFDAIPMRDAILAILKEDSPYKCRLKRIARKTHASLSIHTDGAWRGILSSLEYLKEEHRALFSVYSSKKGEGEEHAPLLARALAYFVYRHASSARDEEEFRCAVGFSLLCERLLSSMIEAGGEPFECARILSEEIEYSEENTEILKGEFLFY